MACSLQILTHHFRVIGMCHVNCKKHLPNYINLDCTLVVKARPFLLNEKRQGVKNMVETFDDVDFNRQDQHLRSR